MSPIWCRRREFCAAADRRSAVFGALIEPYRGEPMTNGLLSKAKAANRSKPTTVLVATLEPACTVCHLSNAETVQPRWRKIVAGLRERCVNCIGRISVRPRSRGGVKVPTGGDGERSPEPASARRAIGGVSRFGAIPKPTVTVRMEENGKIWRTHACRPLRPVSPDFGLLG
jgi:hypothetical protein